MFETVFWFERGAGEWTVPRDEEDLDGLGFLAGRTFRQVAWQALQGTMLSHTEGGTPNLFFTLPDMGRRAWAASSIFWNWPAPSAAWCWGSTPRPAGGGGIQGQYVRPAGPARL